MHSEKESKESMKVYGMYLGPKQVPIYLLQGPSMYHIATWTLRVFNAL